MTRLKGLVAGVMVALALAVPAGAQEGTPAPASGQVSIGETEVSWGGEWRLAEEATTDELVTLVSGDSELANDRLVTYAELEDDTVEDGTEALDVFADAFLSESSVSNAVEVGAGELDDGAVWKVFTYDLDSMAMVTVFAVSAPDDNTFLVSTLTAPPIDVAAAVADAQDQILLDGEARFLAGIDGAAIAPAPVSTPVATPSG